MSKPEFIDNQGGRTLANALRDLAGLRAAGRPSISRAAIQLAGFLEVADVIESRPAFRLLLGAEPESPLSAERWEDR